jgi:molybdate transport system substrate-binding protein
MTAPAAQAPVLAVLCAGACREIVNELGAAYAARYGVPVRAEFATSAAIGARVGHSGIFDLIIATQAAIAELERVNEVTAGTAMALARSRLGVAVAAGRPKPDIGSVAAFVAALRGARSIACADPALCTPSGLFLAGLFERLGLAAELKPRLRLIGAVAGQPVVVCEAVVRGEAELGLQQISEIVAVSGVDLVGPLPAEIQETTEFSVALAARAPQPALARDFAAFLISATAKKVIAAHGMEPVARRKRHRL